MLVDSYRFATGAKPLSHQVLLGDKNTVMQAIN